MTERSFDTLTRSLGRRRAVQGLAAAATATFSSVTLAGAKSNNNKNKQKNKKQKKKIEKQSLALCAAQIAPCQAVIGGGTAQAICCQELADCDFGGLVTCLDTADNL